MKQVPGISYYLESLRSIGVRLVGTSSLELCCFVSFHFQIGKYGLLRERADQWNELLDSDIAHFAKAHEDSTALFFSSADTFDRLLDDPALCDFGAEDGAWMWVDHIHPTSRVHDYLAADLAEFLKFVQLDPKS